MSAAPSGPALMLTNEAFAAIVAQHVAAALTPEKLQELAEREISKRIGQLTLEQAAKHLGCKNVRQLTDFCREHKIPIQHFGPKKRFILLAEIEKAQKRFTLTIPDPTAPTGTKVAPTEAAQ